MPDAEKKKIANLTFNIKDATNSLDEIDRKLKSIAETSEKYSKTIANNLNKINAKSIFDTTQAQKEANQTIKLSQDVVDERLKNDKVLQRKLILQNNQYNNKIAQQNNALANKQILDNNRVLSSTKTMYDKIAGYAETYILYQGFNILKNSIKDVINEMVNLESEMVQIDRVLNENNLNIDNYRDKLINLAYDYGNSMDNVTDIALRLAQAGYDSNETLALTEKTLLALNTAELNATQATDDMVAVMAQWGLMTGTATEQAENYGEIIDKVNKLADNFPTTSADLMDALKKVSSAFNLAGASIDETLAVIVATEKASQRGGKAIGTALSNITQQLKETKKINIAETLGLDFYTDATKTEFKDIMDIFAEMSEKMQELKDAGKENSVEMQNLLSIFTVFRRNIGASLLGEMSGEDSTYLDALNQSLTATGYSLQENEKYLKTTKAAQEQFNAELLKLKTEVWDNQVESVYRDLLQKGSSFIEFVTKITKEIGVLPTAIGLVAAAITAAKSKINIADMITLTKKIKDINSQIKSTGESLKIGDPLLKGTSKSFKQYATAVKSGEISLKGYAASQVKATATTAVLTAASVALNAILSMGIGLALTAITSAIDNWIHAEEKAIERNKELIEKSKENAEKYKEEANSLKELGNQYEETIKKYNQLKDSKGNTTETEQELYELQTKINEQLEGTGKRVDIINEKTSEVNDKYKEQLNLIKSISYEKQKESVEDLKDVYEKTAVNADKFKLQREGFSTKEVEKQLKKAGYTESAKIDYLDELQTNSTVYVLEKMKNKLEELNETSGGYSEALKFVNANLKLAKENQQTVTDALNDYKDALGEMFLQSGQINSYNNFLNEIFNTYESEGPQKLITDLKQINDEFSNGTIDVETYFNKIQEKISVIDLSTTGTDLEAYQAIFAATTQSLAEGIESLQSGLDSGAISFAEYSKGIKEAADNTLELYTLQNDIEFNGNDWVNKATGEIDEYANSLAYANGRLNELQGILTTIGDNYDYIAEHANASGEAMFNATNVASENYQNLAAQMENSLNQLRDNNKTTFEAIANDIASSMGVSTNEILDSNNYINEGLFQNSDALNAALNSSANQTGRAVKNVTTAMGDVLTALGNAISNFDYNLTGSLTGFTTKEVDVLGKTFSIPSGLKFELKGSGGNSISALSSALKDFGTSVTALGPQNFKYTPKTIAPYTGGGSGGNSGGGSTGTSASGSKGGSGGGSSSYNDETKAEEEKYKNNLKLFEDYVDSKEKYEEKWVKRYSDLEQLTDKDYLYITKERINRYKQYLSEIEKMTWLKDEDRIKLQEKYIDAIKDSEVEYLKYYKKQIEKEIDALEEANKEKIQLIKDEADARINALKKVKEETSRLRDEEDYDKERQEILEEISYWEQRTGREAAESLKEAKESLAELDKEWRQQLEDWSIEDQIQAIEDERDAEIKAIEDSQAAQIKALQEAYDARVKLYAETGQIIYDQSIIESSNLYNAYKDNFVNPIMNDLQIIQDKIADTSKPATTNTAETQYETYNIKSGDTLSGIAKRYNTTIAKIMEANPYVTNANKIYAGKTLQIPKFHNGGIVGGTEEAFALLKPNEVILKPEWAEGINKLAKLAKEGNNISNTNTTIEVKGDLVRIDANIKDKTDAEYLTRKVEKMLKDKFNIKK